ncbi:MAG: glycerophosphodiester phosphodiesterase [Acidobacteria bacterium]|nr:glycerophosphodiester phosphodiesterase [Acidobacteriota bacterium]
MPVPSRNAAARSTFRPLLLGHRGARNDAPENTFAAFDLALEHGCDGFEFDVRRTADGKAIVCHDSVLAGLEIAKTAYAEIADRVYAETIPKALRILRGRLPEGGHLLPCLEDVLARYAASAFLDIELKVAGLEDDVLRALGWCPPHRGFVVSSFLPEVLSALRARDSQVPLGLICDRSKDLVRWTRLPIQYVIPHHKLLTRKLIEEMRSAGQKILVWTVNSRREMLRFAGLGVNGIISDDTVRLAKTLGA